MKEFLVGIMGRAIEVVETLMARGKSVPGADPKDLAHLLSAAEQGCDYL